MSTTPHASSGSAPSGVGFVPVGLLRESYARLRPGAPRISTDVPAALPIRVASRDDGTFEVLDGFKRLRTWRGEGHTHVPVVVEPPGTVVEDKARVLTANAPPRTVTALDEARVVLSMIEDDGLTQRGVARRLGRKPWWVACRVDIGRRLSKQAETHVAQGRVGPTLAHALCTLPSKDQDVVLAALERHALKGRDSLALVSAYRAADEVDRRALLSRPLDLLRPRPSASATVSPRTVDLEHRLEEIRNALVDLAAFTVPAELPPAEQRRLLARLRSVRAQLEVTAAVVLGTAIAPSAPREELHDAVPERGSNTTDVDQEARRHLAPDEGGDRGAPRSLRVAADRPSRGPLPEDRPPHPGGGGPSVADVADGQALRVRRPDPEQGREGPHDEPHPSGDP